MNWFCGHFCRIRVLGQEKDMRMGNNRRTVTIRNNHTDHRKIIKRRQQIKLSLFVTVIALLLVLGIYFKVDKKIMSAVDSYRSGNGISLDSFFPATSSILTPEDTLVVPEVDEQALLEEQRQTEEALKAIANIKLDTTVVVTGDVELSTYVQNNYGAGGIDRVISPDLRKKLKNADILEVNNEFAYSTRGTQAPDKQFTFRVDPSYVSILTDMGVDVAGLANNHVLDYGKDALEDTFDTLSDAGIAYMGAGRGFDEASGLIIQEVNDKKIGFLAASRVIPVGSWDVRNSQPGVFTCYDTTDLVAAIGEAKSKVDFLIVCVHWGKEHTTQLTDYQPVNGHAYIDAGADIVIGAHPHVLQGIEYYNGKPIFYSLGNFIFNENIERTAAVKLVIDEKGQLKKVKLIPAYATGATTTLAEGDRATEIFSYMESISQNAAVSADGEVSEKQ